MTNPRVRIAVALALTVVAHLTLLSRLRIDGIRPDALLLFSVIAGLLMGPERGAIVGFFAGVLADLFIQTPMGLSALAYSLIAFGVGSVQAGILRTTWWIPVVTAFAASGAGVVLFALLAAVVGHPELVSPRLVAIAACVAAMNAALAPAGMRLLTWAMRPAAPERAYA